MRAGAGPAELGTVSNAGLVTRCTSGRVHAGRRAEGNPKREGGGQRARVAHVGAWDARWAVCTHVDECENEDAGLVEGEQADTWERARVHREVAERQMWDPGRAEGNAVEPVGAGDSPDKAHDDQTLGSDEMDGGAQCGGEWEVEVGNDVQDGLRGGRVDDDLVVAVEVVAVAVEVDDDDATVVAAPAVELGVAVAAVVVVVVAAVAYA
jgi:hypothetical protein